MSLMESVIDSSTQGFQPRILLYGLEKIGKSTLAASAPSPIFLPTENGLRNIRCKKVPKLNSFAETVDWIARLTNEDHRFETLVIDSISVLERLIFDAICRKSKVSNIALAEGGFGKGYDAAMNYWRILIRDLDNLQSQRSMAIILVAHAEMKQVMEPEKPAYHRHTLRLHEKGAKVLLEWADVIAFATRRTVVDTIDETRDGKRRSTVQVLGDDTSSRILQLVDKPTCQAGNRFGITEDLPLSWSALIHAISAGMICDNNETSAPAEVSTERPIEGGQN